MYAVHSWVVAQVLSFFTTTVDKGQVALINKRLEGFPAAIKEWSENEIIFIESEKKRLPC